MKTAIKPLVFVDFDETVTVKDTIGLLGQTGVEAQGSSIPWSYFVESYLEDYNREKQRQEQLPSSHFASMTILQQHVASIDSFRSVEKASLDRISASGVLGGFTRQQWQQEGAARVPLRPSAQSTLLNQVAPDRLYIVSLNWCKDWIRGALLSGRETADSQTPCYRDYVLDDDHLLCNDLTYDPTTQKSTGFIQPSILNTSDKSRYIQSILQKHNQKKLPHDRPTPSSIYIGDSAGDLLPLVECDIGIIIGNNSRLLETLRQAEITVKDGLDPLKTITTNQRSTSKVIYRVDDWNTIAESGILA
ncbi:hypothetical protein BCR42DRAFT_389138 [Absidia repens]|uniref:HAD-like domain-containing protein n=1 Tax=Absidia repens TaxID=90262 RepID=A0A1X2IS67_9FUNG|nr:hypothetical protein BCR42DRAFT_389138 [Absidia repens]